MLPVVQDRKDTAMAQPASSILTSDDMLSWSAMRPRKPPPTAMISIHLLQEITSTPQATAPLANVRIIRITQGRPQCYIGYKGEEYEPASDNAYFASEALEYNHALISLNDKVPHTWSFACQGGVLISGKLLQKYTPTILPSGGDIIFTRLQNPNTSKWTHGLALKFIICPASSALCTIQNSSTSWARQQPALNDCAAPDSECARDTALTTPTTPCRHKGHPKVPPEDPSTPREARKRLHSHIEPDDDIALPSRADKSPRVESDRSIPRSPGSVPTSTASQQGRSMNTPEANRTDRSVTGSRSSSVVLPDGPPTPPELEALPHPVILLRKDQALRATMSFLDSIQKEVLDRIEVLFQPDHPAQ